MSRVERAGMDDSFENAGKAPSVQHDETVSGQERVVLTEEDVCTMLLFRHSHSFQRGKGVRG